MRAKLLVVSLAFTTTIVVGWHLSQTSPWVDLGNPGPVPAVAPNAQPVVVRSNTLPTLAGFISPKPVAAADPRGNVIVVAHGIISKPLGMDMLLWNSVDQGNTWQPPQNFTNKAKSGKTFFDPWLETDRRGQFYFIYAQRSDGRPLLRRSKDFGKTWSEALPIQWSFCDRPVLGVSPNGQFLAVAAAMAEKTDNFPTEPPDSNDSDLKKIIKASFHHYAGVFLSRDHGESWNKVAAPIDGEHAIPFAIVIDNSERMAASWIVEGNGSRSVVTTSEDRGQTWTTTLLADHLQPDRSHSFNGARFPVLALDGRSGLHVAYITAGATALMTRHKTEGMDWNQAKQVSSDSANEVRMAAIDACGPMVHVTWFERVGTTWHSYYRGSRDYGNSWSPRICLSQRIVQEDGTIINGFQLFSDDDQSSVTDDGTGRAHAVWCVRGGTVAHVVIDWKPSVSGKQKHEPESAVDPNTRP